MTTIDHYEVGRKKQLGQYFTGTRVGRLLAAIAGAESAKSIIDPMVGSGDLLVACLEVGAKPLKMVGLEIDPLALEKAHQALDGAGGLQLVLGDAFQTQLPKEQFDLVITNPPYVRYQSKAAVAGLDFPCATSVRSGLLSALSEREELDVGAKGALLRAASSYPGTSDLAVPSWILSAALVKDGGMLAIVAPQAWLSRKYAHAVRELLDAAFDIEVVVEDGDASWFDDAQVRTQLVVARRRSYSAATAAHNFVLARATRDLETRGSLVGKKRTESGVAKAIRSVTSKTSVSVTSGVTARMERNHSIIALGREGHVPSQIASMLDFGTEPLETRTLESYGWRCGQGLRTGANDFFYANVVDGIVEPAKRWGLHALSIPEDCLLPAVRNQSDISNVLNVDCESFLHSRVVNLRGWVTESDLRHMVDTESVRVLPREVGAWIERVAATPLSEANPTKRFAELAAVATNAKVDGCGRTISCWYQLPPLAPRHVPEVFMPRICGGRTRVHVNGVHAVIDANFSTFWRVTPDALPIDAMFALLSSSWVWGNLEATCTVLGGGALKVEATDLRRLALPDLDDASVNALSVLGKKLRSGASQEVTTCIDEAILSGPVQGYAIEPTPERRAKRLREFAQQQLERRQPR